MERVKKGEKYWYINTNAAITAMWVDWDMEGNYPSIDTTRFENGNYFHTCAEAEQMAAKLRAVLKGAEVIEMPSEEDMQTLETKDIVLAEFLKESHSDLDMIMHGRHAYWKGWNAAIRWLKSKIVK